MPPGRLNLPNTITVGRILSCPIIAVLALLPGPGTGIAAFALFLAAALSDVWDGYLARSRDLVTDLGKLLDPVADKLLLLSTLVPFYLISHRPGAGNEVPFWGPLPLWVLAVILGRELAITVFRGYASRRGVVIAAGTSGKRKALLQNLFIGGLLLWYPLRLLAGSGGWSSSTSWSVWSAFHEAWVGLTLLLALVMTIYSMLDYLWSYRALVRGLR